MIISIFYFGFLFEWYMIIEVCIMELVGYMGMGI